MKKVGKAVLRKQRAEKFQVKEIDQEENKLETKLCTATCEKV
jgi:hypothetical protein